jgi:CrcB protein
MVQLLFVGVGGFFGAIARFAVTKFVQSWANDTLPYGTLTVNILGCLLLGFLMQIFLEREFLSVNARLLVTTGFLGALTTFSTFSYETYILFNEQSFLYAGLNILLNLVLGFALLWTGVILAKLL